MLSESVVRLFEGELVATITLGCVRVALFQNNNSKNDLYTVHVKDFQASLRNTKRTLKLLEKTHNKVQTGGI